MQLQKINEKLWVYVFDENIVITALVNNHKAILIDAGFEEHAKKVKESLDDKKIKVETIIFTHYHPDHVAGSNIFKGTQLLCSSKYEHNYDFFLKNTGGEFKLEKPTKVFENGEIATINGFKLNYLEAPGHSECSSIIVINNDTVHVGDLMMQGLNDKPALPCVNYDGSIKEHIRSLELILDLQPEILIMGHGSPLSGKEIIQNEVNKRLFYLKKIAAYNGQCELQECLPDDKDNWELHHAHESNLTMYKERG